MSQATNLVPGDTNGFADVFVRDRTLGETTRVSVSTGGAQVNSWGTGAPSISADGNIVAFESNATTLVAGMSGAQVYVRNRAAGTTAVISTTPLGVGAGCTSSDPSISANGVYVAFESCAPDLVPGDDLNYFDVFVRDRSTGTLTRFVKPANYQSYDPAISANGDYVAFTTGAPLVAQDTTGSLDVYVANRASGAVTRRSVATDGTQGNDHSETPAISSTGRYVAFGSWASNLVTADTNNAGDVFLHDRGN